MRFAKSKNILKRPKSLLGFLLLSGIAIALYLYLSLFWPSSLVFSKLNFVKAQGYIQEVNKGKKELRYTVVYMHDNNKASAILPHQNYFTDEFEKGDTLTVFISPHSVRIPKIDGIDAYIWFLLFCFGIIVYIAALLLKNIIFPAQA